MLKIKFLVTLAAITLLMTGASTVFGQSEHDGLSLGPSTRPFGSNDNHFNENELYEYDAQLWAPYDVTRMDGTTEIHQGFYSRVGIAYMSISGPDAVPGRDPRLYESVTGWNTAWDLELGYNTEGGKGWSATWLSAEGSHFLRDSEYRNRQFFGGFQNPAILRTTFDDFALNRQFRQRLSNGGYIEPYFGLRYLALIDETNEDQRPPLPGPARRFSQETNNSMAGGHLGTKYFRTYGRFTTGWSVGMGMFYNDQTYSATSINAPAPESNEPAFTITNRDSDFVPVLDLGIDINYFLTRDISIRAGAELRWAWQGVARVDTTNMLINPNSNFNVLAPAVFPSTVNSEDLVAAGFTLGIDWRR